MQATVISMLLISFTTVIDAGVITNRADSGVTLDHVTKLQKGKVADENHKSLFPKNYTKIDNTESYENLETNKSHTPEKMFASKNIPRIKDKLIIKNPQQFTVDPLNIRKMNYNNHNKVPIVNITDDRSVEDFVNNNISMEAQVEMQAVEISLENDNTTTEGFENLSSLSDQDNIKLNQNEKNQNPILKDFLEAHIVIPTKCDIHSDTAEEKNDIEEFIFLEEFNDADGNDYEMRTEFFVDESRFKRSINVIEEETLGTTVSGFKFTGTGEILGNDLYFKNINS